MKQWKFVLSIDSGRDGTREDAILHAVKAVSNGALKRSLLAGAQHVCIQAHSIQLQDQQMHKKQ